MSTITAIFLTNLVAYLVFAFISVNILNAFSSKKTYYTWSGLTPLEAVLAIWTGMVIISIPAWLIYLIWS